MLLKLSTKIKGAEDFVIKNLVGNILNVSHSFVQTEFFSFSKKLNGSVVHCGARFDCEKEKNFEGVEPFRDWLKCFIMLCRVFIPLCYAFICFFDNLWYLEQKPLSQVSLKLPTLQPT